MSKLDDLMDRRSFGDDNLRGVLDEMTSTELVVALGSPTGKMLMFEDAGWSEGDGRPAYADDDPAVMAALSRCATNRVRYGPDELTSWAHPAPCGWCDTPLGELLVAAAWAVWASRWVTVDLDIWNGANGTSYVRNVGGLGPQNPAYQAFVALSNFEQQQRVAAAVEASR